MKCFSPVILLLLCLHATAVHVEPPQLERFITDVAPGKQVDIVFVIDQSTDADEAQFYSEGRRLVGAILEQYVAIHQNYARVAVITFAGHSRVQLDYIKDNRTTATKCDFFDGGSPLGLTPWERVKYVSDLESTSGKILALPLQKARSILATGKLYRPNATQILLVLTDGNYGDKDQVLKEVKLLNGAGVVIYTCGTGSPEKHDTRVRILASRGEFYGSYEDWRDMLTTKLTSYKSDTLPLWSDVADADLCQPSCIAHSRCQCDILRHVLACRCAEGYYLHNGQCTACPENTYKELAGDHDCDFCPPDHFTSTDASKERYDCYCTGSYCVDVYSDPELLTKLCSSCATCCKCQTTAVSYKIYPGGTTRGRRTSSMSYECGQSDRCPDRHVCRYTEAGLSQCECQTGWNGTKCRTNPDNCIDNDCENGEECVDMLGDYVCIKLMPPTETPSPTPTTTTDEPTSRTTSPTAVTVIPPSTTTSPAGVTVIPPSTTTSPAGVTDTPTSVTTGSSTATTTQGAPTSGSSLGLAVGLGAGVGGIVIVIVIVAVVIIIIKRKSPNRNDASPESPEQKKNSDQRDSKNVDYDNVNVYDVIDDTYTGLSERTGSATYTSLTTSTEATDPPVYLEILPEV